MVAWLKEFGYRAIRWDWLCGCGSNAGGLKLQEVCCWQLGVDAGGCISIVEVVQKDGGTNTKGCKGWSEYELCSN